MAARPRSHKISIPNLYCKLDKRTGKVYWQYKHPLSGRFHSLGTDENEAKQVATEANTIIAEQRTRQILSVNERLERMKGRRSEITVTEWLDKYISIQEDRLQHNELRPNSYRQKGKPIRLFREHCGMQHLKDITALDTVSYTHLTLPTTSRRQRQMCIRDRHNTQDMFRQDLTQRRQQNNREIE